MNIYKFQLYTLPEILLTVPFIYDLHASRYVNPFQTGTALKYIRINIADAFRNFYVFQFFTINKGSLPNAVKVSGKNRFLQLPASAER